MGRLVYHRDEAIIRHGETICCFIHKDEVKRIVKNENYPNEILLYPTHGPGIIWVDEVIGKEVPYEYERNPLPLDAGDAVSSES